MQSSSAFGIAVYSVGLLVDETWTKKQADVYMQVQVQKNIYDRYESTLNER